MARLRSRRLERALLPVLAVAAHAACTARDVTSGDTLPSRDDDPVATDAGAPSTAPVDGGSDVDGPPETTDAGHHGAAPDASADSTLLDAGDADDTVDAGGPGPAETASDAGAAGNDTEDPSLPPCPTWSDGTANGVVLSTSVREASGVVEGRRNPGVLWTHNDSGGDPQLFAISTAGRPHGTFVLQGADARDWEDLAMGPGPDPAQSFIYVADIGDNGVSRPDVQVYRVAEPEVDTEATLPAYARLEGVETFVLAYPDGAHNAETFLVDPLTGDAYVVVKDGGGTSPVFRAAAPLDASTTIVMEQVATLIFGQAPLDGDTTTTGGDIAPSGEAIAIRTYDSAFLWRRPAGMSVADALAAPPCPLPLRDEQQGEALGFAADGAGYFTVSEGGFQTVWFFARQ